MLLYGIRIKKNYKGPLKIFEQRYILDNIVLMFNFLSVIILLLLYRNMFLFLRRYTLRIKGQSVKILRSVRWLAPKK